MSIASAQNQTIAGNLTVTGTAEIDGNAFTFGTQGASTGLNLSYADADNDTLTFYLNRSPASWLWAHAAATAAMRLTTSHDLVLYKADGTTAGLTLSPTSNTISLGSATLYQDSTTGALRTGGAFTVDGAVSVGGAFSAASYTTGSGLLTGGVAGLTLNAGGSDQNIVLAPSGAGSVTTNSSLIVNGNGSSIGNNPAPLPGVALNVSGIASAGAIAGLNVLTQNTNSATSGDTVTGVSASAAYAGTGNLTNALSNGGGIANAFKVMNTHGGTVAGAAAVWGRIRNGTYAGTITEAATYYAAGPSIASGATITNYYGFYYQRPSVAGTLGTSYGLYLEDTTLATSSWAIYSLGGTSYHAGQFRIGQSTDHAGENLQVTGTAYVSGDTNVGGKVTAASGRFDGPVRLAPQGDLSMGSFTSEP